MAKYSVWIRNKNSDRPQPLKTNMTVAEATTFVTKRRETLGPNEELLTENQDTNEVDMLFSKTNVITPNDPWYLQGNRLVPMKKSTPNSTTSRKSSSNYTFRNYKGEEITVLSTSPSSAEKIVRSKGWKSFELVMTTKNAPSSRKSSRKRSPNYVPNMRRMKSKDLSSWLKAGKGTPKQRKFAYSILKSRQRRS